MRLANRPRSRSASRESPVFGRLKSDENGNIDLDRLVAQGRLVPGPDLYRRGQRQVMVVPWLTGNIKPAIIGRARSHLAGRRRRPGARLAATRAGPDDPGGEGEPAGPPSGRRLEHHQRTVRVACGTGGGPA
jgi:hypothetical protein